MPVPREWRANGIVPGTEDLTWEELRPAFVCSFVDSPGEILKQRAAQACKMALHLALEHHIADEHTRACEVWLGKSYGAEWKLIDELRPKIAAPFAAGPFAPATP